MDRSQDEYCAYLAFCNFSDGCIVGSFRCASLSIRIIMYCRLGRSILQSERGAKRHAEYKTVMFIVSVPID
jgi:hypothetical protein